MLPFNYTVIQTCPDSYIMFNVGQHKDSNDYIIIK